jgi:hypothetical protein
MAILGPATASATGAHPAFRLGLDMSVVISHLSSVEEVRSLPRGSVVGDLHGGLTFNDAIAAALERRSRIGWREIEAVPGGDRWTIIVLDR